MSVPARSRPRCAMRRAVLPLLVFSACATPATRPAAVPAAVPAVEPAAAAYTAVADSAIGVLRAAFAPDRRTDRFDVEARAEGALVLLGGETTSAAARDSLLGLLTRRGVPHVSRITLLPDSQLGEARHALAGNSVTNLRTTPGHASELATQVLLGMPLDVLREQDGFVLVRTPERYLAWVDGGGIRRVTAAELRAWLDAPRIVYLRPSGIAWSAPDRAAEPVADLVLGAQLLIDGAPDGAFFRARMPDGRLAYVARDEAAPYNEWLATVNATEASLVATARSLLGRPYLWGGTSANGMDCSGFTKTVYLLNGVILPRDASQQVHAGTHVDDAGDFSRLRPGDLLFFGRAATASATERVTHVGMWIGNGRFIHSAGRVRINSMDPAEPDYDASNRNRYLRSRRILGSGAGVTVLNDVVTRTN